MGCSSDVDELEGRGVPEEYNVRAKLTQGVAIWKLAHSRGAIRLDVQLRMTNFRAFAYLLGD
jgi:hypothetical protein